MLYFRNGLAEKTGSLELKAALLLDGTFIGIICLQKQLVMYASILPFLHKVMGVGAEAFPAVTVTIGAEH